MKPPRFDYYAPESLDEALALLEKFGSDARVLAGGQSLVPLMNMRLASPQQIVDINRIALLNYIEERDGYLCLGALTRHRAIERSALVAACCPLLAQAATLIGHTQVRTRGTIGGSVAHADPAAEYPVVLATFDGVIVAQSSRGQRAIAWQQFFLGPYTVDLQPDEMVVEIRLRKPLQPSAGAFLELSRRHGDFALVEAAVQLQLDGAGACTDVQIALGGVGGTPVRATSAEKYLCGRRIDATHCKRSGALATDELEPDDNLHATAEYQKRMASLLVTRALTHAAELAATANR
jgi:aerobic carbon-monoxide dehydrogenase medium subunit